MSDRTGTEAATMETKPQYPHTEATSDAGFIVAIPARFGSTRLPGKPLLTIAGQPMIAHVVQRALEAGAQQVVVATDDPRIADAVGGLGIDVCMTEATHQSGTDRLAEVATRLGWDEHAIVVNLQGDEPLAPPAAIRAVVDALRAGDARIATLAVPLVDPDLLFDPNCVKLVRDAQGRALYFSRAPIPWARDAFAIHRGALPASDGDGWLRHIGLYAYRVGALREFAGMPVGRLERIEALEQLRALEAGWSIAVALSPVAIPAGVDTEDDLARVRAALEGSPE
jgi:3-deoxy-manno-octulosonate cytidylyltransferase (CMP-KDO synthetase)